jgi:hypothetical protein
MESNDLSLAAIAEKLKELAPAEAKGLSVSMISRHAAGQVIPGPAQQDLYLQLTGAAVTPNDWFALSKNPELGRKTERPQAA